MVRKNEEGICLCICHTKGKDVKHVRACCDLCYKKYLNEDGTIDRKEYSRFREEKDSKK